MSLILQPQNSFTVVRQIADHTDTSTYYVRAVVRNAYTDEIIITLDLTDKGAQRFKKDWQVSADPSGQGFYISVVTSVYTDTGYTTKSVNYGDEEDTYLVQDRVSGHGRGGGGGLDARTTRRIFMEELANIEFPKSEKVNIPKQESDTRVDTVLTTLGKIQAAIEELPKDIVSLSPIIDRLNGVEEAIKTKPVTPETDLRPIVDKMESIIGEQDINVDETKTSLKTLEKNLLKKTGDIVIAAVNKAVPNSMGKATFNIPMSLNAQPEEKEDVEEPFNINKLTV